MQDMLLGLAQSDKGNLTEVWEQGVYGREGEYQTHVEFSKTEVAYKGVELHKDVTKGRVVDGAIINKDGTATTHELKSTDDKISKRDKNQDNDTKEMITHNNSSKTPDDKKITIPKTNIPITAKITTFTSPKAAKANVDYIIGTMLKSKHASVEIFDKFGNKYIIKGGEVNTVRNIHGKLISLNAKAFIDGL